MLAAGQHVVKPARHPLRSCSAVLWLCWSYRNDPIPVTFIKPLECCIELDFETILSHGLRPAAQGQHAMAACAPFKDRVIDTRQRRCVSVGDRGVDLKCDDLFNALAPLSASWRRPTHTSSTWDW